MSDESKRKFRGLIKEVIAENKTGFSDEFEAIGKNGQSVWGVAHAKVNFKDGKPDSLLVFAQDITERKKAEAALKDTQRNLQDILNGVDDGIALVSLDGRILNCNEPAFKKLGLKSEELIGTNVYDIVIPEDRPRAIEGALKVLETGRILNEVGVLRKNNTAFCAEISVTALYDKNGKPVSFVGVVRDITERKKTEEALRK